MRPSPRGSSRLLQASALLALGIGCTGAALGLVLGVGSTGSARVSLFGLQLEEVPAAWVAAAAAILAVVAALLTARGWRGIRGRVPEDGEVSVQTEALGIRRSLLAARVEELEAEVAELERRRDESRQSSPVVAMPDLDESERATRRWRSTGSRTLGED